MQAFHGAASDRRPRVGAVPGRRREHGVHGDRVPGDAAGRRPRLGVEQGRERAHGGPPPARRSPSRPMSSTRASGIGSSMNSQITVRSLGSSWKQTPWSIVQMRPSSPRRQCPPLRSALFTSEVEGGDRSEGIGEAVLQGEVVLLRVERDEPLHRAGALRSVAQDGRRNVGPTRAPARRRRRPPHACTATPVGSPTGGSRPAAACRRRASARRRSRWPAPGRCSSRSWGAGRGSRARRSRSPTARPGRSVAAPSGRSSRDTRVPPVPSGSRRTDRWGDLVRRPQRRTGRERTSAHAWRTSCTVSGSTRGASEGPSRPRPRRSGTNSSISSTNTSRSWS